MTDWTVQSVVFCLKTARKLPEIERKYKRFCYICENKITLNL